MKPVNVVIIASPTELDRQASESNIATIVDLLTTVSDKLFLISGSSPYGEDRVRHIKVKRWRDREKDFMPLKLVSRIITDLRLTLSLLKIANQINIVLYYIGAKGYLLSILVARLLRKKIVVYSFSSMSRVAAAMRKGGSIVRDSVMPPGIMSILEKITFALSHQILVQSKSVISFSGLNKYRDKIAICRSFYIDTSRFRPKRNLEKRGNTIGYLGRFDENKGVLNFVRAMPLILKNRSDVKFILFGDGELLPKIHEEIKRSNLRQKVRLTGEIPRNKVPDCLNELRLFVLSSYSEGLPNVVQEAMACGTPVLATTVGGVPDLITDGETGFIMGVNSPECIAENVIRALEHPNLGEIAQNACKLIEREYTYEVIAEEFKGALSKLIVQE